MKNIKAKFYSRISVLSRSTISIVLIILLCMISLSIYLVPKLIVTVESIVYERYNTNIKQTCNSVDNIFLSVLKLPYEIERNSRLRPYNILSGDTIRLLEASNELQKYVALSDYYITAFLYVYGSDKVIGMQTVYDLEYFGNKHFAFSEYTQQEIINLLNTQTKSDQDVLAPTKIGYRPDVFSKTIIPVLMTVPKSSSMPYGTLMLLLDEKRLSNNLKMGWDDDKIILLDKSNNVVKSSKELTDNELQFINKYKFEDSLSILSPHTITNNETTLVTSIVSQKTNMKYLVLSKKESVYTSVRDAKLGLMIYIITSVMGIVFISSLLLKWNYKPIKMVMRAINNGNLKRKDWIGNEGDIIQVALTTLKNDKEYLQKELTMNKQYVKYSVITRLVMKQYDDMSEINEKCLCNGIDVNGLMSIIFINLNDISQSLHSTDIINKFENLCIDNNSGGSFVELVHLKVIMGIISLKEINDREIIIKSIEKYAMTYSHNNPTIYCGPIVESLEDLAYSFNSVSSLFNNLRYSEKSGVFFCSSQSQESEDISPYPVPLLQRLDNAILLKDGEQILHAVDLIKQYIKDCKTPNYIAKLIGYDSIQMLTRNIKTHKASDKGFVLNQLFYDTDWTSSSDMMCKTLEDVAFYLKNIHIENKSMKHNILMENILTYIDKNYTNSSFSISLISQTFNMSESAFSHMFKRNFGITFISYINNLKVEKAKELLVEGRMTINEISDFLGYSNSSNFGRMFKNMTGMSPSQYNE